MWDAAQRARVGHDHVHAAEPIGVLLHPDGQCGMIAGVDRGTDDFTVRAEFPAGQFDAFGVAGADRDLHALGDEALHHGPADPAAARGHQGLLAGQPQIHPPAPTHLCII